MGDNASKSITSNGLDIWRVPGFELGSHTGLTAVTSIEGLCPRQTFNKVTVVACVAVMPKVVT